MLKRSNYVKHFVIEDTLNLANLLKSKALKSMGVKVKNKTVNKDRIKNNKINKKMIQFPNYQLNIITC